jgi:Tol biopolymer transport system component
MKRVLAILGSAAVVALVLFAAARSHEEGKEPTPLPAALGAIHPRISPDGTTLAVAYQGAIWTVPARGGVMTRLTDGEGFDHEPAWSPDGKRIAFVRGPNQFGGDLHVINAADGKFAALPKAVNVRGTYNFQKLEFSPDGTRLLSVFREGGKDVGLAWYDLKTGDVKPLDVLLPSYSSRYGLPPDGQWIVFTLPMDKPGEQSGNNARKPTCGRCRRPAASPRRSCAFPRAFTISASSATAKA